MSPLLTPLLGKLFDQIFPDPKSAADAKLKVLEMQQAGDLAHLDAELRLALGQAETNKTEAGAPDLFTRGWRPSVGWVCSAALAYEFLLRPLLIGAGVDVPELPMEDLNTLLWGLLGLGTLRTAEKIKGVAK